MRVLVTSSYDIKKVLLVRYLLVLGFGLAIGACVSFVYFLPVLIVGLVLSIIHLVGVRMPYKCIDWQCVEISDEGDILVNTKSDQIKIHKNQVVSTSLFYSSLDKKKGSATLCLYFNDGKKYCLPGLKGADNFLAKYYQ